MNSIERGQRITSCVCLICLFEYAADERVHNDTYITLRMQRVLLQFNVGAREPNPKVPRIEELLTDNYHLCPII